MQKLPSDTCRAAIRNYSPLIVPLPSFVRTYLLVMRTAIHLVRSLSFVMRIRLCVIRTTAALHSQSRSAYSQSGSSL